MQIPVFSDEGLLTPPSAPVSSSQHGLASRDADPPGKGRRKCLWHQFRCLSSEFSRRGKNVNYALVSTAGLPGGMAAGGSERWPSSHNITPSSMGYPRQTKYESARLILCHLHCQEPSSGWNESLFKSRGDECKGPDKFYGFALGNRCLPSFTYGVAPLKSTTVLIRLKQRNVKWPTKLIFRDWVN